MSDIDWLRLVSNSAGTFVRHGRCLSYIGEQLASPSTQFPGLVLFLGQHRKDTALRCMFPKNRISEGNPYLQLRVDSQTFFGDHPIFFADCDPHLSHLQTDPRPGGQEEIRIHWATQHRHRLLDTLLARLLFLFVDVICIFANDFGGLDAVRTALTTWATLGRHASSLEHRPRVVIAVDGGESVTQNFMDECDFQFHLDQNPEHLNMFCAPSMLFLPPAELSGVAQYRPLKDEVLKALDMSRRHRREDGFLFSALHLERFFNRALLHLCRTTEEPFDFVRAARETPEKHAHASHLKVFLGLTKNRPWDDRAEFIASTLLVDAYTPGKHHFSPAAIFDSLYRESCKDALTALGISLVDCQRIEYHLARLYNRILSGRGPLSRIHASTLAQWRETFSDIFTNRTCLVCLKRAPQHKLFCGHAYCDVCAATYSQLIKNAEYRYLMKQCVLCQARSRSLIQVLPPTACVRAITIDGGGVRGFIPLRFLGHMQALLGPECPVQDLVDVAFGTSSGGYIVLSLFHQRLTVGDCAHALSDLMWRFLRQHPPPKSIWAKLGRALHCWWTDGWYSARAWDKLLQQQFGLNQEMFGSQLVSGTKVAVTTTAELPVLLPNYRRATVGIGREDRVYYHVHEAIDAVEEPKSWECARATTAAPVYFEPYLIRGVGSCVDGGIAFNNPAPLCRSELPLMWPSRSEFGALVSLGTGSANLDRPPIAAHHSDRRRRWASGFAFRLYDSFMASMDAEQGWRGLLGQVNETARQNYHRLNVEFPGKEPSLNAVDKVQWMTSLADQKAKVEVPPVLTSLLLASLFLELSLAPHWEDGYFHCNGVIRCRLPGKALADTLRRLHPKASTYIVDEDNLDISPFDDAVCQGCARYCVPIRFAVRDLDSEIILSLQLGPHHRQKLGGFPLSLRWFLDQQGLDAVGHTANVERLIARTSCTLCDKRERRNTLIRTSYTHKKRVRFI